MELYSMGGDFGREWINAEYLCCSPETTTYLLIGYTPNKQKSLRFEKNILYFKLMKLYIITESGFFYQHTTVGSIHVLI